MLIMTSGFSKNSVLTKTNKIMMKLKYIINLHKQIKIIIMKLKFHKHEICLKTDKKTCHLHKLNQRSYECAANSVDVRLHKC